MVITPAVFWMEVEFPFHSGRFLRLNKNLHENPSWDLMKRHPCTFRLHKMRLRPLEELKALLHRPSCYIGPRFGFAPFSLQSKTYKLPIHRCKLLFVDDGYRYMPTVACVASTLPTDCTRRMSFPRSFVSVCLSARRRSRWTPAWRSLHRGAVWLLRELQTDH